MAKKSTSIPSKGIPEAVVVTDTLDLHGFFPEQVGEIIQAFVRNALDLGLTTGRIIHGKGKSRLKYEVRKVLKTHPSVRDFHDAPPDSGGWGATVVELIPHVE
ncbi:MAG: Smr/MutS family protein [bacterium]